MQLRTLLAVGFLVALLIPASSASAYTPRHGKSCRHGYVTRHRTRRRHGRKHRVRICVKRKATLAAPIVMKLHAHLDPSFSRDSLDPFKVTYQFSASATQARTDALTASIVEEPAPLPSGVLSLYTDGKLECAVNVGGSATASECPVTYEKLGEHRVTTLYTSGEESATETEVENIGPLATTTSLSVVYAPLSKPIELRPTSTEEAEGAGRLMQIGNLVLDISVEPAAAPAATLSCGTGAVLEGTSPDGCYQLAPDEQTHVYEYDCAGAEAVFISARTRPVDIERAHESKRTDELSPSSLEAGELHMRAVREDGQFLPPSGYGPSEATTPMKFVPEMFPTC